MRLLQCLSTGEITMTANLHSNQVPQYAILSHTWGDDGEEVTFDDMIHRAGQSKAGYQKIKFCAEQATGDGLRYFWVDSCCIDKSNKAELQDAISSMFNWYQRSHKCYVYLSDVLDNTQAIWETSFRQSRWFTRGWTLQELLAPASVEFFAKDASRLGDKHSLEQQIREVTGLPVTALRGEFLSQFTVNQRMSWIEPRQTKIEEDRAYSLLGIFGVTIPLRYGEGQVNAFQRLEKEIDKLEKCLRDIRLNDPYHHKKHIEHIKGGLLEDSYRWILNNHDFRTWRNSSQGQLLWIKGDPGKGKTMLLCGIINELKKSTPNALLSYFFCEATNSRINNATAMLRGLIYMVISQQPSLVVHILKKYDRAGKALFEDSDAWFALSEVFTDILRAPTLKNAYLIIDALDECVSEDLTKLVDFVVHSSSLSPRVKWLVSSRNWPLIEERMKRTRSKMKLCLELNADSVSAAVNVYIQQRVQRLVQDRNYNDKTRDTILDHLFLNADNTFLWVALVCDNLSGTPQGAVVTRLKSFPPGLDSLYHRMMAQICQSKDPALCKHILGLTATVCEPLSLTELSSLLEVPGEMSDDLDSLQESVGLCGSFLVVRNHRVHFVHQSAKDYLLTKATNEIFPFGIKETHHQIFSRSIKILTKVLRRNIYNLDSVSYPIEKVRRPEPDPLAASRYSCLYWTDHLCEMNSHERVDTKLSLSDASLLERFIREKCLYWLEAVSLCRGMTRTVLAMAKVEKLIQRTDVISLLDLIRDAQRFMLRYKLVAEFWPLQVYVSGLIFNPSSSLIRRHFDHERPRWTTTKPHTGTEWSTCLQALEGHSGMVNSVAFSYDSTCLASGSADNTVRIWDVGSGACLQILAGHCHSVDSVTFLHNPTRLASGSKDRTVKIWDFDSGACLLTLRGHDGYVSSVAVSDNSMRLASASSDCNIKVWDASDGECLRTLEGHVNTVTSVTFSHDSMRLASGSRDRTIKMWSANNGECLQNFKGHIHAVNSVAFSHDSTKLASASDDFEVRIWDAISGACLKTLSAHRSAASSVVFMSNSTKLASASWDHTVKIWDLSDGACLETFWDHSKIVNAVACSHDSTRLASVSNDRTVRVWDTASASKTSNVDHFDTVTAIALSSDLKRVASTADDCNTKIWDVDSGVCLQTLNFSQRRSVRSMAFSHNSNQLAWGWDSWGIVSLDANGGEYVRDLVSDKQTIRTIISNEAQHTSSKIVALSPERDWITYKSRKVIWLPPEYRPSCFTVRGRMVCIGGGSGKVWWCTLNFSDEMA